MNETLEQLINDLRTKIELEIKDSEYHQRRCKEIEEKIIYLKIQINELTSLVH